MFKLLDESNDLNDIVRENVVEAIFVYIDGVGLENKPLPLS